MTKITTFALNTIAVIGGGIAGMMISKRNQAEGAIVGAGIGNALVWTAMLAFPGTNSPTSPVVGTSGPCWTMSPGFP